MGDESIEEIMARALCGIRIVTGACDCAESQCHNAHALGQSRAILSALHAHGYEIREKDDGMISIPEIDPRRPMREKS